MALKGSSNGRRALNSSDLETELFSDAQLDMYPINPLGYQGGSMPHPDDERSFSSRYENEDMPYLPPPPLQYTSSPEDGTYHSPLPPMYTAPEQFSHHIGYSGNPYNTTQTLYPNQPYIATHPVYQQTHSGLNPAYTPDPSPPTDTATPSPPTLQPGLEKKPMDIERWWEYAATTVPYFDLYDSNNRPVSKSLQIRTRMASDKLEFSAVDEAFIVYRQNQLTLEIDFVGDLSSYSTEDKDQYFIVPQQGGGPVAVELLLFHIYAIGYQRGQSFAREEKIELLQSVGPRNQKTVTTPGLNPIKNGRSVYGKLAFKEATKNNAKTNQLQTNPHQQFFRIVISVVAKTATSHEFVISRISPPLIVRGQNPGKFKNPLAPTENETGEVPQAPPAKVAKTAAVKRPRMEVKREEEIWERDGVTGSIHTVGKVGINATNPKEALDVHGNIMLTGTLLKPSDQRIKTNIQPVNTADQLNTIDKLGIYDYQLKHSSMEDGEPVLERGVIAQHVQKILPSATRVMNNVTMPDGTVMPELILVKERELLYENIGATKELNTIVKKERENVSQMGHRMNRHIKEGGMATNQTLSAAGKLLDFILTERQDVSNDNTNICCFMLVHSEKGFYGSLFGLGPAWTLYLLGFFMPPLWLFGGFFLFSPVPAKKIAGALHLISLVIWGICIGFVAKSGLPTYQQILIPLFIVGLGILGFLFVGLGWRWKRMQRQHRAHRLRRREAQEQQVGLLTTVERVKEVFPMPAPSPVADESHAELQSLPPALAAAILAEDNEKGDIAYEKELAKKRFIESQQDDVAYEKELAKKRFLESQQQDDASYEAELAKKTGTRYSRAIPLEAFPSTRTVTRTTTTTSTTESFGPPDSPAYSVYKDGMNTSMHSIPVIAR